MNQTPTPNSRDQRTASAASAAGRRHSGMSRQALPRVLFAARAAGRCRARRLRRLPGLGHALEAPAAVRFPQQVLAALAQFACGAMRQRFGGRRTAGSGPGAPASSGARRSAWRGLRLPAAWRRPTDGFVGVPPGQHFADVQAGARLAVRMLARSALIDFAQAARRSRVRSRGRRSAARTSAAGHRMRSIRRPRQRCCRSSTSRSCVAEQLAAAASPRRSTSAVESHRSVSSNVRSCGASIGSRPAWVEVIHRWCLRIARPRPSVEFRIVSCHSTRLPPMRLARYSAASARAYQSFQSLVRRRPGRRRR